MIAGVNKAGTTSLFVSLSEHPQVAPSAVKETRHFLPGPLRQAGRRRSRSTTGTSSAPPATRVRLEATPSYFYGGAAVARRRSTRRCPNARIIVVLREPVARTISFFQYQKTRLRIPAELTIEEYLAHADSLTAADFLDPENERYFAVGGSRYADFLPGGSRSSARTGCSSLELRRPDRAIRRRVLRDDRDVARARSRCCCRRTRSRRRTGRLAFKSRRAPARRARRATIGSSGSCAATRGVKRRVRDALLQG